MSTIFESRLRTLEGMAGCPYRNGLKGIEKESLRVSAGGRLATTPHPPKLGSALTHPHITTDYSEALLELITPPYAEYEELFRFMTDLHTFVYANIDAEILWATSMPGNVGRDPDIPIANYGSSNVGRMKTVYRIGLGNRYGRRMQTIAGAHFNYSFPEAFWKCFRIVCRDSNPLYDFINQSYFALIRNFQRTGWIIPYLFGASTALHNGFIDDTNGFKQFDKNTWFLPYATSLRMSDVGYKNKAQASLCISYNNLDEYISSLTRAISSPYPDYEKIGVKEGDLYHQLNPNILQIENEFYSFVRPKNIAKTGEKPTHALERRGVRYVEIRALDINLFEPLGLGASESRFLEAYLISAMLEDSPLVSDDELTEINYNQSLVACRGRKPGLSLQRRGSQIALTEWATEICNQVSAVADYLDSVSGITVYKEAVERHIAAVKDPEMTPSARVLAEMRAAGESFIDFALRKSREHAEWFRNRELAPEKLDYFNHAAQASLDEQLEIEQRDNTDFDTYLERYFSQVI